MQCVSRSIPFQSTDFLPSSKKGVIMVGNAPSGSFLAVLVVTAAMLDDSRNPRKRVGATLGKENRALGRKVEISGDQ